MENKKNYNEVGGNNKLIYYKNNITIEQSNLLKLLAITFMLVDHIGAVFFPEYRTFRIIGRLALPLFTYQLCIGFECSKNINNYIYRLFILAIVSQAPYMLLFQTRELNIIFGLALSILILKLIEEKNNVLAIITLGVPLFLNIDYELYLPLLVIAFYYTQSRPLMALTLFSALNLFFIKLGYLSSLQAYSVLALPLVYLIKNSSGIRSMNKEIFYLFYPLHIFGLYIMNIFILK